jgi:hypothetical protein
MTYVQPPDLLRFAATATQKQLSKKEPQMNYPGMYLKVKKRSPGEERLEDFFWPADCVNAPPEYFRECITLLNTVKDREAEIVTRLRGYLEFAKDPEVRNEIDTFIRRLEEKMVAKTKKAGKDDRTKR